MGAGPLKSNPPRPEEELLNAALRLLSVRSRGVEELRGRLLKKGFPPGEVENCLKWLEARDLLDDGAFSRALVRDRVNLSPRGPSLLQQELWKKGVARATAEKAVEAIFQDQGVSEGDLAEKAARGWVRRQGRRAREALVASPFTEEREKARRRLFAFLGRRGFRGEAASRGMEAGEEEARILLQDMD